MEKETSRKIWSLWGAGLGLLYGIGAMLVEGIGIAETFGMVLGGWIVAMLSHTTHHFLYARKGLNLGQKPFVRISKSVMLTWLLILILFSSLFMLTQPS